MKDYIEERAVEIATYIIENNATVRQTAKQFGISQEFSCCKSTDAYRCRNRKRLWDHDFPDPGQIV